MQFVPTHLPPEDEQRLKTLPGDTDDLIFCFGCPEQLPVDIARWTILGNAHRATTSVAPTLAQLDPAYAKKALDLLDAHLKHLEETKIENYITNTLFTKAECLLALRRQEEAIAHWQQILERFPTNHLFKRAEELIKITLGVSEKQVALGAALASCTKLSSAISGATHELETVVGLAALEPRLEGIEKACANRGGAERLDVAQAWFSIARRAGEVRQCDLYEKWRARTLSLSPMLESGFRAGPCAP